MIFNSPPTTRLDPWILIGTFTSPGVGITLYNWDTTPIPHGVYYLRLTVRNACGLESSDVTAVRVDHVAPTVDLVVPGPTVCGVVEFEGSAVDPCMNSWTLEYSPAGAGNWVTINSGGANVHCTPGTWDTVGDLIADGEYDIRLRADDVCGNFSSAMSTITVDNSAGCGCGPDVNGDGVVNILDLLEVIAGWSL